MFQKLILILFMGGCKNEWTNGEQENVNVLVQNKDFFVGYSELQRFSIGSLGIIFY